MPCPVALSLALALPLAAAPGPACPRLDRPAASEVMAALRGAPVPGVARPDPAFEAAIRAIRAPAPKPRKRRHR